MKIQVCTWKTCKSRFSEYILTRLESDKDFYKLGNLITEKCPCTGNCKEWPIVVFDWEIQKYMSPTKASELMREKRNPKKKKNTKNKNKENEDI